MPKNPWLRIPADDYDAHMAADGVAQAQALDRVFGELYAELRPARLAVLGCGTGNGLRHVDPAVTRRVIAVDVNPDFLALTRTRNPHLTRVMATVVGSVTDCALAPREFNMIHAALLLEYVDPDAVLARIPGWLAPGGALTVVIQEPGGDDGPVSDTPYESLRPLAAVMRLHTPDDLRACARARGLHERRGYEVDLPRGKRFYVGVFASAAPIR